MWPDVDWGELGTGALETVGGASLAVGGVFFAVVTSPTVVGTGVGVTGATLGVVTTGFGIGKIADSFRSKGTKAANIPSSSQNAIAQGAAKKLGASKETANTIGAAADLIVGGKPTNAKELIETGNTLVDMLGNHSSKIKKSGMQQDHTKTPAVKSKPVSKSQQKPQTVQSTYSQ